LQSFEELKQGTQTERFEFFWNSRSTFKKHGKAYCLILHYYQARRTAIMPLRKTPSKVPAYAGDWCAKLGNNVRIRQVCTYERAENAGHVRNYSRRA
jgi:hypothetical protein